MSKKLSLIGALICVVLLSGSALAQDPVVVLTFPASDAVDVSFDDVIFVDFNVQMDGESFDESSMIVTGSLTGFHEGEYAYSPILRRVYFEPTVEFGLGEVISVQLTTAITAVNGTPLLEDYSWSFTITDPGVASVTPRDGDVDIPVDDSLIVYFNGNMSAASLTNSTFTVSGSRTDAHTGEIEYNSSDMYAVFYPDTPFGLFEVVTVTLTTGVQSLQGVALPTEFVWTFTTVVPMVESSTPANGTPAISVDTFLTVTFNGAMDATSFAGGAVTVSGSRTGNHTVGLSYDEASRSLTITPDVPFGLEETITTIVNTLALSAEGVALAEEFVWGFITAKPAVIAVTPLESELNVANDALIVATFNGAMDASTFSESTILVSGRLTGDHPGSVSYDALTRQVTFNPTSGFVMGEVVNVTLTTDILSAEGSALVTSYVWSFTTKSPEVLVVSPAANMLNVAADAGIQMTFDLEMDTLTFNELNLVVDQRSTGVHPGSISYDPATLTANFVPAEDYQIGDVITVMATIGLTSTGGVPLAQGYIWSFTVAVEGGSGSFSGQTSYATGSFPRTIISGDADNDGDLDLITSNAESDNLTVLWNDGSGTYSTSRNFTVGNYPSGVVIGDFDRDGWLDLVSANFLSNNISYLEHLNNPLKPEPQNFQAQVQKSVGDGPRGLTAADLNGDGLLDLITANMYSNDITVYLHTGELASPTGLYDTALTYGVGASPRKVFAADLDGDMDIDLVTANAFSNDVTVLFNHGDGTFDTDSGIVYLAVGDHPYAVTGADLDADGDIDLVTTDAWADQVTVLVNGGDGSFVSSSNYAVDQFPRAVFAADADFDGNGLPDLATVNADDNTLSLLLNNGTGGFDTPTSYAVGLFPFGLCVADVDNDGDLDIMTANAAGNDITVLFNGGTVTSVEGGSPILPVAYSLQQNYPNPFNPTTTIEYSLGRSGDVTLEVFNALGQRVLDLALGHQAAGPHRVSWDGRDRTGQYLPSGVYFYRLSTGDFEQTKKMVLMK